MVKQIDDSKTVDVYGLRKRGRPSTGAAKSAAQRKREQRQRDELIIWGSQSERNGLDIEDASLDGLLEAARKCTSSGSTELLKVLCSELLRRSKSLS